MNYCKQTVKYLQTTDPLPSASSVLFHVEVMKFQWWLHVAAFRWGQCQKDVLHTTGLLTTVVCADVSDSCLYSSYCVFGSLGFSFFLSLGGWGGRLLQYSTNAQRDPNVQLEFLEACSGAYLCWFKALCPLIYDYQICASLPSISDPEEFSVFWQGTSLTA